MQKRAEIIAHCKTHIFQIMHPQGEGMRGTTASLVIVPCVFDHNGYIGLTCEAKSCLNIASCANVDLMEVN